MLEESLLREQFEELLEAERQAVATYRDMLGKLEDAEARQKVEQLLRDKQRHVELTERLLEIMEGC